MSSPEPLSSPAWRAESAWAGILQAGRRGRPDGPPGIVVRPVERGATVTVMAAEADMDALAARVMELYGVALPRSPRLAKGQGAAFQWAGAGQWIATSDEAGFAARLAAGLGGLAAVVDQGSARAVLEISGPRTRDVLAKGCILDLHPRVFAPGDVALTMIAHMTVHLVQIDEAPSFELSVFRSLAGSLLHWLTASAEEYGALLRLD